MSTVGEIATARTMGREAARSDRAVGDVIQDYCQYGYPDDEVWAFIDGFRSWRTNLDASDIETDDVTAVGRALEVAKTGAMRVLLGIWRQTAAFGSTKSGAMTVVNEILAWAEQQPIHDRQENER